MFKYLFVLSFIVCGTLQAEELKEKETDIFFKIGGGARMRQYFIQDGAAGSMGGVEDFNDTSHRLQLDLRLDKGEYFQTFFRAINAKVWGDQSEDGDKLVLQQGWGNWKVSDFLNLKFGRQPLEIGRGLVYGFNEWENLPTAYDGFSALFSWSVLDINIHAFKLYELERSVGNTGTADPEVSNYIMTLGFKDISDKITMADFSFVQTVSEIGQIPGTTTLLPKQRLQRLGFDLMAEGVYFAAGTSVSYVVGKESTTTTESDVKQFMLDGEAKWIMPDWDQFNLWVGAHYDSGDDDSTDGENSQYEPLNYNLHQNAGRMDFFKFGNLTFLRGGASIHTLADWYMGFEYFMFQKTQKDGAINLERSVLQTEIAAGNVVFADDKDLGQELDFWVGKVFPSGVRLEASFNYLDPGSAMKKAVDGSANPRPLDNPIYNFILDIGIFF